MASIDLGSIIVRISSLGADATKEDLKEVEDTGKKAAKNLGKAFKTFAVAGVGAIATLGACAVKYNSDMEQYQSSFATMLGSQEKATQHINELKDFAAKTPFEMKDLAEGSKTLMAFGTDVSEIKPALQMLGDISLGNGEKFKSLSLVFGQVKSQGKLMGQDLMQMINGGFNPLQVISEKTGKSMAVLKDEMSKGQISFEMVADAMKTATSEGGQFYGSMDNASQTMSGQWSTIKDNFNSLNAEVFQSLSDVIQNTVFPIIQDLMKAMQDNMPAIKSTLTDIVDKIAEFIKWVSENGDLVLSVLIGIGTAFVAWNVASMIMGVVASIKSFGKANEGATIAQWALNAAQTANPIGIVIALVAGLVAALVIFCVKNDNVRESIVNAYNVVKNYIINFLDYMIQLPSKMLEIGTNIVQGLYKGIINTKDWLLDKIKKWCDSVLNGIKKFFGIKSPSKETEKFGKYLVQGLAQGIEKDTSAEEALKIKCENLVKILNDNLSNLNLDKDIFANQYELWKAENPNANFEISSEMELVSLNQQYDVQHQKINNINTALSKQKELTGETSIETMQLIKKLQDEKIILLDMRNEIDKHPGKVFSENKDKLQNDIDEKFGKTVEKSNYLKDVAEKQYELWELQNKNADYDIKNEKKKELLNQQLFSQNETIKAVNLALKETIKLNGENSSESQKLQNQLLDETIANEKLKQSILEVNKAKGINGFNANVSKYSAYNTWMKENYSNLSKDGFNYNQIATAAENQTGYKRNFNITNNNYGVTEQTAYEISANTEKSIDKIGKGG